MLMIGRQGLARRLDQIAERERGFEANVPRDTLLLFRLGDFHDLFSETQRASAQSRALTKRNGVPIWRFGGYHPNRSLGQLCTGHGFHETDVRSVDPAICIHIAPKVCGAHHLPRA